MVDFDEILDEVKRGYRIGLASEEKISLLASVCDGPQIDRLIRELDLLQDSDIEHDSGDSADEYDRLRNALSHTLV